MTSWKTAGDTNSLYGVWDLFERGTSISIPCRKRRYGTAQETAILRVVDRGRLRGELPYHLVV
jgi:hypothetical protein